MFTISYHFAEHNLKLSFIKMPILQGHFYLLRTKMPESAYTDSPDLVSFPAIQTEYGDIWSNCVVLPGGGKEKMLAGTYRTLYVVAVNGTIVTGLLGTGSLYSADEMTKSNRHRYVAIHPTRALPNQPPPITVQPDQADQKWPGYLEFAHPVTFSSVYVRDKNAKYSWTVSSSTMPGERCITNTSSQPDLGPVSITLTSEMHAYLLTLNKNYASGVKYTEDNTVISTSTTSTGNHEIIILIN